jgi:Holliday junction resolvase RusA-like endonuclease
MILLRVPPMPKPRMTRADRWRKRPVILRYWEWCEAVRREWGDRKFSEHDARVVFFVPMPKSWSAKKREAMAGKPHQQTPDVDNYLKALLDAIHANDCRIWRIAIEKRWAEGGFIEVWP